MNAPTNGSDENMRDKNPLEIGFCTLEKLEENLKAFRLMNQISIKKRYLLAREAVKDSNGKVVLQKSAEFDISIVRLLRRYYSADKLLKTFQPDEGIMIMSDMSDSHGVAFSMDIVTQVLNIAGGVYEGFIERVDSCGEFLNFLKKSVFPRILLIGYLPDKRIKIEKTNLARALRVDQFIRMIEITHSVHKKQPYFPKFKQVHIDPADPYSWGRLTLEIIREYTKDYFMKKHTTN